MHAPAAAEPALVPQLPCTGAAPGHSPSSGPLLVMMDEALSVLSLPPRAQSLFLREEPQPPPFCQAPALGLGLGRSNPPGEGAQTLPGKVFSCSESQLRQGKERCQNQRSRGRACHRSITSSSTALSWDCTYFSCTASVLITQSLRKTRGWAQTLPLQQL